MRRDRIVFRGRLLNVRVVTTKLPNGYTVNLEVIKHPGAGLVVPFLDKNKIIMLRQYRPVIDSYIYELPAGTVDEGESAIACVRREIIEETGYTAKKFKFLGKIYPVPGYSTEKIVIYKAWELKKTISKAEKDEVIEPRVFNKADIRRLFRRGRIVDAKTIAALVMCGWL